jgi:purine catabolism regulator
MANVNPIKVKDIMEVDFMAKATQLVGGKQGVNNIISYVTIMEAPDFYEWVTGGEYVLTTLYAFKDQPELQVFAFTELAKRGIGAMGIKVNRFIQEIPQKLIEVADEFKIPLFAIKRETKFREIVQAVSAELNNYHMNILLDVEKHYHELVTAALAGGNFDTLLRGLGRKRNCTCLFFDREYKLIGMFTPEEQNFSVESIAVKINKFYAEKQEVIDDQYIEGLHIFPCIAVGNLLGFLVLVDKRALNEKFILMAKQLTTFLSLRMLDQIETEQKVLAALLDDILFKHDLKEQELRERLALFGLKFDHYYRVLILRLTDMGDVTNSAQELRKYGYKIKESIGVALFILKVDEGVLIISNNEPDVAGKKPYWFKKLIQYVHSVNDKITLAIGPSVEDAKNIERSYGIAMRTLKAGRSQNCSGVLHYVDYLVHTLVQRALDTPEEDYLVNQVIKVLAEYDKRYNTNLLLTLESMLFSDDLEKTAAEMHVHANTIRYRLHKIHDITGSDFFNPFGRYVLTTAVLLYSYEKLS